MKRILIIGFTTTMMSFANLSYAHFSFHSNAPNVCEYVAGQWTGTGKASNWIIGDCLYHGLGKSSTLDASGNFTIDVSVDKESGSRLCPNHAEKKLSGICANGEVIIKTNYGELAGTFTKNTGEAKGKLYVGAGISADVFLQFKRIG